jgi:hypothetical protein
MKRTITPKQYRYEKNRDNFTSLSNALSEAQNSTHNTTLLNHLVTLPSHIKQDILDYLGTNPKNQSEYALWKHLNTWLFTEHKLHNLEQLENILEQEQLDLWIRAPRSIAQDLVDKLMRDPQISDNPDNPDTLYTIGTFIEALTKLPLRLYKDSNMRENLKSIEDLFKQAESKAKKLYQDLYARRNLQHHKKCYYFSITGLMLHCGDLRGYDITLSITIDSCQKENPHLLSQSILTPKTTMIHMMIYCILFNLKHLQSLQHLKETCSIFDTPRLKMIKQGGCRTREEILATSKTLTSILEKTKSSQSNVISVADCNGDTPLALFCKHSTLYLLHSETQSDRTAWVETVMQLASHSNLADLKKSIQIIEDLYNRQWLYSWTEKYRGILTALYTAKLHIEFDINEKTPGCSGVDNPLLLQQPSPNHSSSLGANAASAANMTPLAAQAIIAQQNASSAPGTDDDSTATTCCIS